MKWCTCDDIKIERPWYIQNKFAVSLPNRYYMPGLAIQDSETRRPQLSFKFVDDVYDHGCGVCLVLGMRDCSYIANVESCLNFWWKLYHRMRTVFSIIKNGKNTKVQLWISAQTHNDVQAGNGPLTRYVKLRVAHAPGMPGTFSPPPDFKGNRWLATPACITARA